MKHLAEPVFAFIIGLATWQAWNDFILTLIVSLLAGAFGFLGKYLMQRAISKFNNRKNKPIR